MGCPPVRGDNPRALASGLSCVQVDKHGITILYHLHQCRPCTSRAIFAKVGKGGIIGDIRCGARKPPTFDQGKHNPHSRPERSCLKLTFTIRSKHWHRKIKTQITRCSLA